MSSESGNTLTQSSADSVQNRLKVLLAQTNTSNRHAHNIAALQVLAEQAATSECHMLCLPEVSGLMNQDVSTASGIICEEHNDPYVAACKELAAVHGIWIHNGSTPVMGPSGLPVNRTHLINASGDVVARYDKIHLFDIYLPDGRERLESRRYSAGSQSVVAKTPWGPMGLSICYDLRFPQLYREYAQAGARVVFVPSAFTQETGQAHWEVLLRARAIENGCFIIAAAQTGKHADGRKTYGHSLFIHPWGNVIADLGESICTQVLEVDLSDADTVRQQIPSLSHGQDYQRLI